MDQNPLRKMAEEVTDELLVPAVAVPTVVYIYHTLVEALVHPHNAEAVREVRRFASLGAHVVAQSGKALTPEAKSPGAFIIRDTQAALDALGLVAMDYETEVKPGYEEGREEVLSKVEKVLGEELLKQAAGPASGLAN